MYIYIFYVYFAIHIQHIEIAEVIVHSFNTL